MVDEEHKKIVGNLLPELDSKEITLNKERFLKKG